MRFPHFSLSDTTKSNLLFIRRLKRYLGKVSRIYFRADAGFASPEVYEFLEGERIKYAIRLPANRVLQDRIGHLKRPALHKLPAGRSLPRDQSEPSGHIAATFKGSSIPHRGH